MLPLRCTCYRCAVRFKARFSVPTEMLLHTKFHLSLANSNTVRRENCCIFDKHKATQRNRNGGARDTRASEFYLSRARVYYMEFRIKNLILAFKSKIYD